MEATAPCVRLLAGGGPLCSVAICLAECCLPSQQPTSSGGWHRLELFSSIQVGSNLRHVHTFGCPVFDLQNVLASGSQLPRWSPRAHLGLNLGPSPLHTGNVYLVLNLVTGCVSPQYHYCFDNFFETSRHGALDDSGTICWQQLANLNRAKMAISKVSVPIHWRCRLLRSLIL